MKIRESLMVQAMLPANSTLEQTKKVMEEVKRLFSGATRKTRWNPS